MSAANSPVAERQALLLRKLAIERALDFSNGRPPTQEQIAEELGVSSATIRNWFNEEAVAEILDEVAPVWPNIAHSRNVATENLETSLQFIADLALGRIEKARAADRLKAAQYLVGLAGVKPGALPAEREAGSGERRPAINIELFVSGTPAVDGQEPQVIDGVVRVVDGAAGALVGP